MKQIHLDQTKFRRLTRLGSTTPFDEMGADDAEACRQIGLFFAHNKEVSNYAIDIVALTLTPRTNQVGEDIAPLAEVVVERRQQEYRLTTNGDGLLPPLPFGTGFLWTFKRRR